MYLSDTDQLLVVAPQSVNRSDMPWGTRDVLPGAGLPRDDALRRDYQKLIGIRKAHPALSRGNHTALSTEGDLYIFARRDAASKDLVVVAVNRGSEPATATFAFPMEWEAAKVVDSLDASTTPPTRTGESTTLAASHSIGKAKVAVAGSL